MLGLHIRHVIDEHNYLAVLHVADLVAKLVLFHAFIITPIFEITYFLLGLLKARRSLALGATVRRTRYINLLLFTFEVFILRLGESINVSPITSWLLESH
jgi:hypothetical protein